MRTLRVITLCLCALTSAFTANTYVVFNASRGTPTTVAQTVHVIWYGNIVTGFTATMLSVIPQFITDFSTTQEASILPSYTSSATNGVSVSKSYTLGTQDFVAYNAAYGPAGTLTPALASNLIQDEVTAGHLPTPASARSAVYIVMMSAGYLEGGLSNCAQHDVATISTFTESYILVNDMTQIGCNYTNSNAVSGSVYTDQQISLISHELAEAAAYGWEDNSSHDEIADMCLTSFSPSFTAPGGQLANQISNGHFYYVQNIWLQLPTASHVGACAGSFTPARPIPVGL